MDRATGGVADGVVPAGRPATSAEGGGRSALMPSKEAADYLGVSVNTLYYWNTKGTGPRKHKVGRYSKYSKADLQAFLDSCREDA